MSGPTVSTPSERSFGDEIVREPVGQLGKAVRSERRNHEQIGPREVEVQVLGGRPPDEREERLRSDEALRAGGDEWDDVMSALHEQANEVASLVRGDPTGDADEHSSHAAILPFRHKADQKSGGATSGTCT